MVCRAFLGKIAAVAPTHLSLRSLLGVSRIRHPHRDHESLANT